MILGLRLKGGLVSASCSHLLPAACTCSLFSEEYFFLPLESQLLQAANSLFQFTEHQDDHRFPWTRPLLNFVQGDVRVLAACLIFLNLHRPGNPGVAVLARVRLGSWASHRPQWGRFPACAAVGCLVRPR